MFAKLNLSCPNIEIKKDFGVCLESKNKENISYEDLSDEKKFLFKKAIESGVGAINYFDYDFDKSKFQNLLPISLHEKNNNAFTLQVVKAKSYINPHRDDTRKTAINFYLKTNKERTVFYKNPKDELYVDGNFLYDLSWIEECGSFVAEDFDVYVLDVNEIHSVMDCKGEENLRIAVSFGTTMTYNEVYKILKDNNLIWRKND